MKIFSFFFAFALAQDETERGKNDADEKGAQMCLGVKVSKIIYENNNLFFILSFEIIFYQIV
jgi:hypothetical protein